MLARKKKWETNLGSECEGSECERSEGESTPKCEGLDIEDGGLIGDEDGLIRIVANGYRRRLPEPSRMVCNDWVWVWVRTDVNGFAGAVTNGSQRLGLGLGSNRCEWLSVMVWELLTMVWLLSATVWTKLDSERGAISEKSKLTNVG